MGLNVSDGLRMTGRLRARPESQRRAG
jgi:hypothetical protein